MTFKCELISRKEAQAQGLNKYFTGKPCKRGHISPRYTAQRVCVACYLSENKKQKDKEYREKNAEKCKENSRRWKAENPDYQSQWREKNPTYWGERYENDKERILKVAENWRQKNREKVRTYWRNRHARLKNAGGSHTAQDVWDIFEKQKFLCVGCDTDLKETTYHVDHIHPISKGGTNWPDNLQILCPTCNTSKAAKTPDKWVPRKTRNT